MRESKDKIKSRMIRNAARIWGFQEPQSESSFDPVVSLLLGACAFELEKISSEINNTESRIIERLVNILTPQPITSAHPAYAVAFARPSRKGARALPEYQFYVDIKVSDQFDKKVEDKQIFFSPTGTFNLTDGRVRYLAAQKRMYEIVDDQYKDIVAEMFKTPLPSSSLYIGLEMNERLSDITLFFDIISDHLKQPFFNELEGCRWKIGNAWIDARKGIADQSQQDHDVFQLINREADLSSKISCHVNRYFSRQFVNIKLKDSEEIPETESRKIPEAIVKSVDRKELANIDRNIIWIELQFNTTLSDELLENLTCSLNCFPVINRRQNEFTGSTRDIINIIPLHTEDVFFDLKRVTNSNGEAYKISHFKGQGDLSKGSALLRQEGVGRFDSRTAMEYLEYLLELMKEESAAFNVIGSDMISSNLRELNQVIARLEKKIEDVKLEKGDTAYLMLKPQEGDRQVFVEYWSINSTLANNIRAGSMLNIYRADDLDYNSAKLMTTTTGGKDKPSTEARINTYRRALQSGNRVVTREDIKALCFEHCGDQVLQIDIEKGVDRGTSQLVGFIRTTDIHLYLKKGLDMTLAEQNSLRQKLLVLLEERSSNIFPFRIFFEL
ncbi:MAG: type VI secretion system baseplate subunit TssF [Bacteroidales bacterium]|nr:type VI secretion system baseplate subunit TssF [Bacteroidales bacterium]